MNRSTHKRQKNTKHQDSSFFTHFDLHRSTKRLSVLLFGLLPFLCVLIVSIRGISLNADTRRGYAYVSTTDTSLAVRLSAGTNSMLLDRLQKNSQILVTGAAVDGAGDTWYEIKYLRAANQYRTGYVHSDYVKFYNDIAAVGEDPEFEIFMESQKFPESYKVYLRILHKQHPSWIFNAQHIDMEWSYALAEESKVGTNMVQKHFPASWFSMEEGAFDWKSQTWKELDTNCYGSSATITAYFLDPRNGLYNDSVIFQFEDLSYIPELHDTDDTASDTYNVLKGTFLAGEYSFEAPFNKLYPSYGMVTEAPIATIEATTEAASTAEPTPTADVASTAETTATTEATSTVAPSQTPAEPTVDPNAPIKYKFTYVDTLLEAAKYAKVSPFFIASRIRQEVGSGSQLSFGTYPGYEGYFNFFNIGAYAHSNRPARENGAIYAKNNNEEGSYLRPWSNPYRSILGGADFLGSGYIRREQNTLYLQKFDVTDGNNGYFYHQYMSNVNAPSSEASSMKKAYTNSGIYEGRAFSFQIPVYKNMPELAACEPYSDNSKATNNNWLSSISVEGGQFTTDFSRTTYEYTVKVSSAVSKVNVAATPCASGATLMGTGEVLLTGETTKHVITVFAPSYEMRTYTLNIVKSTEIATPTVAPTATPTIAPTATATAIPTATATSTTAPTTAPTIAPTMTPTPDPKVESTEYSLGTFISGVEPQTSVADFIGKFNVSNGSIQFVDSKGNAKATGTVVTGDVLQIYKDSELFMDYPIVIYGDVNADGKISIMDMISIQRQLVKLDSLTGAYIESADANNDKKCSIMDMIAIQRHLVKLSNISQSRK